MITFNGHHILYDGFSKVYVLPTLDTLYKLRDMNCKKIKCKTTLDMVKESGLPRPRFIYADGSFNNNYNQYNNRLIGLNMFTINHYNKTYYHFNNNILQLKLYTNIRIDSGIYSRGNSSVQQLLDTIFGNTYKNLWLQLTLGEYRCTYESRIIQQFIKNSFCKDYIEGHYIQSIYFLTVIPNDVCNNIGNVTYPASLDTTIIDRDSFDCSVLFKRHVKKFSNVNIY